MAIRNHNDGKYIADTAHNRNIIRSGQYSNPNSNANNGYYSQSYYVGSSTGSSFATSTMLIILVLLFYIETMHLITPYLVNRSNYELPYKLIAWFYDYTIVVPYQSVYKVWYWLASLELTSTNGINLSITCVGTALYSYILFLLYRLGIDLVTAILQYRVTRISPRVAAWLLFLMPALALIWYIQKDQILYLIFSLKTLV